MTLQEKRSTGFSAILKIGGKVVGGQRDVTISETFETISYRDKTLENAEYSMTGKYAWTTTLDATAVFGNDSPETKANYKEIVQAFQAGKELDFEFDNDETGISITGKGILTGMDTTFNMDDVIVFSSPVAGNGRLEYELGELFDPNNPIDKPVNPDVPGSDSTAPILTFSYSTTDETAGPVTITVVGEDNESGIDYFNSPDGNSYYGTSVTYDATTNGSYHFEAFDKAGNKNSIVVDVANITEGMPSTDETPPHLTYSISPEGPTSESVMITVNGIDNESGIDFFLAPDTSKWVGDNVQYQVTANGDYTFTAQDYAGNINEITVPVTNITSV